MGFGAADLQEIQVFLGLLLNGFFYGASFGALNEQTASDSKFSNAVQALSNNVCFLMKCFRGISGELPFFFPLLSLCLIGVATTVEDWAAPSRRAALLDGCFEFVVN